MKAKLQSGGGPFRGDPKEREPVDYQYLHTWVGAHVAKILSDYEASVKREPLIPLGAPLDFVPERTQP